ncbi:MAG: hypothetical protein LBK47_05165 [Prevotellaceae bacterium]|jgi:hypothetical protein|nr:hypothetical protein [Prevotellaceae bacterium]
MENIAQEQVATVPMVRIDRNIIHNIDSLFDDMFGVGGADMDNGLLRSVIYYLCYSYQQNLFAYSVFDPYAFAKTLNYTPDFLRQKHTKPHFLEDFREKAKAKGMDEVNVERELQAYIATGAPTYESNLENALWSLWQKEVIFCHGAKFFNATDREEEVSQHTITRMNIIRSLTITHRRSGKTNQRKTMYNVEMDERFLHSLAKYFIRGNKDTLIVLRRSRLDMLYLKLLQYKESAIYNKVPLVVIDNFERLCNWAGVPSLKKDGTVVAPRVRKQLLKDALNALKERTNLDFDYDCVTVRRQKFPYTFKIIFNLNEEKYLARQEEDKADLKQLFQETLTRDLLNFWKCKEETANPLEFDMEAYNDWLYCYGDYNEKISIYSLALTKTYGKWKYDGQGIKSYGTQAKNWLDRLIMQTKSGLFSREKT